MINDNDVLATLPDGEEITFKNFLDNPFVLRRVKDLMQLSTLGVSLYRVCLAFMPLYAHSDEVISEILKKEKEGVISFPALETSVRRLQ